jgi:aminoglycoside/choline kinase family phosphotransferase
MTTYRAFTIDNAITAAQAALSRNGSPVTIEHPNALSNDERRNLIVRASAAHADGRSQPIVIKATRSAAYDPAAPDAFETSGLVKEWAATTLLGTLLAADTQQGVLVLADLGADLPSLVQPLLHGDPEDAEQALTAYAQSLGRLHATTPGCQARHTAIVRSGFPATGVQPPGRYWLDRVALKVGEKLGGELPQPELADIADHLIAPGPWFGLVHRDPCPDNVLLMPDGSATLIDFEFAAPGHVLLDAAYWWFGFPTCWCAGSLPAEVSQRIDHAYRTVLAETLPVAADADAFARESAIIRIAWLFNSLIWLLDGALADDGAWGISTNRNRILHYLHAAITAADMADIVPGIRRTAASWLDRLQAQWPRSSPLGPYPAFDTTLRNQAHP